MKRLHLTAVLLALLLARPVFGMSVPEAYRAIPHRQTTFNAASAKMGADDKAYLTRSFALIDQAMAARVATLQWVRSYGEQGESLAQYKKKLALIWQGLNKLQPASRLKPYHALVLSAIKDQYNYFLALEKGVKPDLNHRLVQRSHESLIQAYQQLMGLYPSESPYNQQAFFDHLCALDFL